MTSTSATSVPVPRESSHRDEFLMEQSLLFLDTLKDLKSLRTQLYSASEYIEIAYSEEEQKQIVEDTLKDYAIKALINTVDHLGSVAHKVNSFLLKRWVNFWEWSFACASWNRLQTCQEFVNLRGLSQQSLVLEAPNTIYGTSFQAIEGTLNDVAQTKMKSHRTGMFARLDLRQFKNIGIQTIPADTPSECVGDEFFALRSPQSLPRQGPQFNNVSMNQRPGNRSTSPRHFPLPRIGSLMQRSASPSHPNSKRRDPSEPRRTVSLSTIAEGKRGKDVEQNSTKSKRLFKAMLRLRKSKKDVTLYKFLDEN